MEHVPHNKDSESKYLTFFIRTLLASADDDGESSAVKTKESINTTSFTEHMTDAADDDEHC